MDREIKRIAIIDLETTDVYYNSSAPVQVAGMIIDEDGNTVSCFNERCKTTHRINPEASAVHGIYEKDLVNCRKESEVLIDFCEWLHLNKADAILTYNGNTFDLPLLNCRCHTLDIPFNCFALDDPTYKKIDGKDYVFAAKRLDLYRLKSLGRKWKLTLVAEKLGISTEGAHDAFEDIRMLRDVYWKLKDIVDIK